MSKEDKPPPNPNHGLFDPASHLLGPPTMGLAGLPFPHLAHLPAFPWLARPPFPPLFGGLGALPNPLLAHGLSPSTGGADWWRAASEHARRMAGSTGVDFFAGSLGPQFTPGFSSLSLESTAPGLEFLFSTPSELDKSALFGMSKHLSELPSSSPSPSSKRSRTPTPAPAHQKSSSVKSSSSSSSSSSKEPHLSFLSPAIDSRSPWHINGSAYDFKTLSGEDRNCQKRKQKSGKISTDESRSKLPSSATSGSPSIYSGNKKGGCDTSGATVLNLSMSSSSASAGTHPSATVMSPQPVTPGVQDLSVKKSTKPAKASNGMHLLDSDSPDVSSPGSEISDNSDDGNHSDPDKSDRSGEVRQSHLIDGNKKQLLADQIRQQLMGATPSPAHQPIPLVIPSLRMRLTRQKDQKNSTAHHSYSLLNLPPDYNTTDGLTEPDMVGLPSSSRGTPPSTTACPFLPGEQHLNHQSKEESQDSMLSYQNVEADDKFGTSGSDKLIDSESQSGWGSDEDGSHLAGSSASPGPSSRGYGDSEDSSPKRRNIVLNEKELIIPLEHGWRRQTTIHGMGRRGIVGEVVYYAPCNKKMKTIPDVMRYLDRHGITDLSRENFTFNTKVNVGQFYEIRDKQMAALSEVEVLDRIAMSKGKRARMQMLARKKNEKQLRQQALAKQAMEEKLKRRLEQQDMARKAAEMKFQMRLEKEQQREMAKKVKEVRLMERKQEKERAKIAKQQEKLRQQEQLRIEREMRAQQIIEARRRRQMELEEMRMKEIIRKNKSNLLWLQMEREREMKKQQHLLMKEQEKERRRQHFLLVKALEQRKKQEEKQEKERMREEKIREKNLEKERKLAQRQMEMFIAREMKKPMDDMELRNVKPLPKFPRCPEAKVSGPAFSDCLMIVEFINNFADALGLDPDSLPTLEVLQNGLLNSNEEDVEEVVTLYLHLLKFALDDLGVPNPREAMTMLNQKITDLEITDATMSEVTRLFLSARGEKKMSEWLLRTPLEALNPTKKAAIIAFICNELLSSKLLSGEIEKQLEAINTLRRDKWIVEGKLRKLRTLRAKRFLKIEHLPHTSATPTDDDSMTNTTMVSNKTISEDDDDDKDEEEDEEEEVVSCDESDATHVTGNRSEDEDEGISKEEMDKKIEKLVKQHNSFDSKVADVTKRLRGTCLGQDRYKRFYWILPATGGIFVEGIESGETEALELEAELRAKLKSQEEEEEKKEAEESDVKKGKDIDVMVGMKESSDSELCKVEGAQREPADNLIGKEKAEADIKVDNSAVKEEPMDVDFKSEKVESSTIALKKENRNVDSLSDVSNVRVKLERDNQVCVLNGSTAVVVDGKIGGVCDGSAVVASVDAPDMSVSSKAAAAAGSDVLTLPVLETEPMTPIALDAAECKRAISSSLLFQEPILSKLGDLLKIPQADGKVTRSEVSHCVPDANSVTAEASPLAFTSKLAQTLSSVPSCVVSPSVVSAMLAASSGTSPATHLAAPSTPVTAKPQLSLPVMHSTPAVSSVTMPSSAGPILATSTDLLSVSSLESPVNSFTARKTTAATTILSSTPASIFSSGHSKTDNVMASPLLGVASSTLVATAATADKDHAAPVPSPSDVSAFSSNMLSLLSSTPISTVPPSSSSGGAASKSDKKSNFISIDALLKKDPDAAGVTDISSSASAGTSVTSTWNSHSSGSNNHFLPLNLFPPSPLVSDHFLKSYADILDQKPWFSVLPRMPCDELSLTNALHVTNSSHLGVVSSANIASASLSLLSLLPMQQAMQQAKAQGPSAVAAPTAATPQPHSAQSPAAQTQSHSEVQTESPLDISAFQAHLSSKTSLADFSLQVSTATDTSCLSAPGADSFKVPAPPSDLVFGESMTEADYMAMLRKVQGERLPIPIGKQRGWWKVSDAEQVRQLYNSLLSRGIRERNLAHILRRYMDEICSQICTQDSRKTQGVKEEKKEKGEEASNGSSKVSEKKIEAAKEGAEGKGDATPRQELNEKDGVVKEEKCDASEKTGMEEAMETEKIVEGEEEEDDVDDAIPPDPDDSWNLRVGFEVEMACLEDVEALEDRIFNASLQIKQSWKLSQRATEDPEIQMVDRSVSEPVPPCCYPMEVARERILQLESNIERRYLKPPLIRNIQLNLANIAGNLDAKSAEGDGDSVREDGIDHNEDVPPGLLLWRRAVQNAQTPAQLNLCTQLLGNSIAWEKSIMRVTCQICLKDDNEAELLLCDGCDKGYHTYCFKPKMETIPEGDWYCYECVSKASGVAHCIVCGGKTGRIVECDKCPRAVHTECLDPPLPRMPKKWQCATCLSSKNKKGSKRKRKETTPVAATGNERRDSAAGSGRERKESDTLADGLSPEKKKKENTKEKEKPKAERKEDKEKAKDKPKERKDKKEKAREKKGKKKEKEEVLVFDGKRDNELEVCGKLLTELEKSEDGWPFLKPVNLKRFPSYKKYIKQPMDFSTMRNKLRDCVYKSKEEFAADIRLILNNCETFNEDDSEVGQAGHSMRTFFTQRWKDIFREDS